MADGCTTLDDVVRRYERLDEVFALVAREGRLRTRGELTGPSFRERGGVLIHVGRDGSPIFNGFNGCHRLAMAKALDLPVMPAQIGWVHGDALGRWRALYRAGAPARG